MAFDTATRNKLARMVSRARTLLTEEFTGQLQEIYGIQPDGTIIELEKLTHLDDEQQAIAAMLRDRIQHLAKNMAGEKKPLPAAIDRMTREQAFTLLNRFAALRMCEERQLIKESIGSGIQSKGFKVYLQIAGSGLGDTYARYKTYLLCLFDEIAIDLGVIFDRYSSLGLLFPREDALLGLLDLLDDKDIQPLWAKDETIGWIYQYFNSQEERKKMREASAAPRNSRELAVRNQFFTPRYVVEFLTDNTLGRIWYEMTQGETRLKDECRYMVRRPNEIFLPEGENAPEEEPSSEDLTQEELLQQPLYIPFRSLKDPRCIRMLDPACGSMHFGLYAFDLYERIYEEAWEIEAQYGAVHFERDDGLRPLHECYESKEEFLTDIPRLIIEHNIHGVDIDPRAVQIAGLSLWLRAQRNWQQQGIKQNARPTITRSNIVCAEPMPGDKEMLSEFTENLQPRVLGQLVEIVFDKMQLAGEAGSLLKIEEEIADAVEEGRQEFNKELQTRKKEAGYLPGMAPEKRQASLFDFTDLPDETEFWKRAEEMIIDALQDYAGQVQNGSTNQRRLFARDAARGFAFIDICRKRYDVVLMNPPFGLGPRKNYEWLKATYQDGYVDMYAAFILRGLELTTGTIGAITSRSWIITKKLKKLRTKYILLRIHSLLDLGWPVMDDATVHSCASVIDSKQRSSSIIPIFDRRLRDNKSEMLPDVIKFHLLDSVYLANRNQMLGLPQGKLLYQLPSPFLTLFHSKKLFSKAVGIARQGMKTFDDFRFMRLRTECRPQDIGIGKVWEPVTKGGPYAIFYSDLPLVVRWQNGGNQLCEVNRRVNGQTAQARQASEHYYHPGGTYSRRCKDFGVRVLPAGFIIGEKGPAILSHRGISPFFAIGLLNSRAINILVNIQANAKQYDTGIVDRLPSLQASSSTANIIEDNCNIAIESLRNLSTREEDKTFFVSITYFSSISKTLESVIAARIETQKTVSRCLEKINCIVDRLWGVDSFSLQRTLLESISATDDVKKTKKTIINHDNIVNNTNTVGNALISQEITANKISYLLGAALGRWDIRIAIDSSLALKLPDPFAPLPVCPPGMLVSPDGLPAKPNNIVSEEWLRARPDAGTLPPQGSVQNPTIPDSEYPLRISWAGILINDTTTDNTQLHDENIIKRVREVLDLLWKEKAPEIEQEACEILGVRSLAEYFRKPTKFFHDHLKRYSKSRRKAPIYWPLSTESGSYTLWLYYHRLTDQTLFTCVTKFIDPKIKDVTAEITTLKDDLQQESSAEKRRKLDTLLELEGELRDFREELLRIAGLPYKPNLNDGVMITAAPLWKLFRHRQWRKDLEKCWKKLEKGEYDWAHLAYSIWPERVILKCHQDRSLAIAHGLEEELWEEVENGTDRQGNPKYKWVPKKLSRDDIRKIIQEKTGK